VLNCNTYDVGLAAAVGLEADKIFILHQEEVTKLDLPAWLPLSDAQSMLLARVEVSKAWIQNNRPSALNQNVSHPQGAEQGRGEGSQVTGYP
jgi:hypothetical protein